jgi:hypothetical protein
VRVGIVLRLAACPFRDHRTKWRKVLKIYSISQIMELTKTSANNSESEIIDREPNKTEKKTY